MTRIISRQKKATIPLDIYTMDTDKVLAYSLVDTFFDEQETQKIEQVKTKGGNTLARINPCIYFSGAIWVVNLHPQPLFPDGASFEVTQMRQFKDLGGHAYADLTCFEPRIGIIPVRVPWNTPFTFHLGKP